MEKPGIQIVSIILCILGVMGCAERLEAPEGPFKGHSVLLISVDTCRADFLEPYGTDRVKTPNIAALANDGIVMERAYTPVPLTVPAHSSLFTGLHPIQHGMRGNYSGALPEIAVTMAELFQEAGYRTSGVIGAILLSSRMGFDQGFDYFQDEFEAQSFRGVQPVIERKAKQVADLSLEWLSEHHINSPTQPFFMFSHFYDPHMRYTPPAEYKQAYPNNLYAGEIAYTDEHIGRMIAYLKSNNLYDDTLIILMADHGEGLGDHGEKTHGLFLYEEAVRIPMIFKLPEFANRPGTRSSQIANLMDVLPTLIDLCGLGPVENRGMSLQRWLLDAPTPQPREFVFETQYPMTYNWSPMFALLSWPWKYIHAPKPELYQLESDGDERENLVHENTAQQARMNETLQAHLLELAASKPFEAEAAVSVDRAEALASLGYAGGGSGTKLEIDDTLPDPKDMLEQYDKIDNALLLSAQGQYQEAVTKLEAVRAEDPDNPSVYFNLGMIYARMQQWEQAKSYTEKALEYDPANLYMQLQLARIAYSERDYEAARDRLETIVQAHPTMAEAHYWLGMAHQGLQNQSEAIEHFDRAKELMPDMPWLQKAEPPGTD